MHEALQLCAHLRHPMHLVLSITGRSIDNWLKYPSIVPTGHILLQYPRPVNHANKITTRAVTDATTVNIVDVWRDIA